MSLFRKKPVVIEAVQFTGGEINGVELLKWIAGINAEPTEMGGTVLRLHGNAWWRHREEIRAGNGELAQMFDPEHLEIKTLEGVMRGDVGDWIIKGIKGEFYPCKNDIFEASYEAVEPVTA